MESSSTKHFSALQSTEQRLQQSQDNLSAVQDIVSDLQSQLAEAQRVIDEDREVHLKAQRLKDEDLQKSRLDLEQMARKAAESDERAEKVKRLAKKGLDDFSGR